VDGSVRVRQGQDIPSRKETKHKFVSARMEMGSFSVGRRKDWRKASNWFIAGHLPSLPLSFSNGIGLKEA
jgi:hypothetical protein